jgi:putative DNA primase/helicase
MNGLIGQFADFILEKGCVVPEHIVADGIIHHYSTNGKKGDTAGWYVLSPDNGGHGSVGDFRVPGCTHNFVAKGAVKPSVEEIREASVKDANRRKAAAMAARAQWNSAKSCGDHPYLSDKRVASYGLRTDGNDLLIPLYNNSGEIQSYQRISPDGTKRFFKGGTVAGNYFLIGEVDQGSVINVCEGYSTAASVYYATGRATVVAFNAGNILAVCRNLISKYADSTFLICADDDFATEGNPGIAYAKAACSELGCTYVIPRFADDRPSWATDFNDLYLLEGNEAVANLLVIEEKTITVNVAPLPIKPMSEREKLIDSLADLYVTDKIGYECRRKEAAEKLGTRLDSLDKTVLAAANNKLLAVMNPTEAKLQRDKGFNILLNLNNATILAEEMFPGGIVYNSFTQSIEKRDPLPWKFDTVRWKDSDTGELTVRMNEKYGNFSFFLVGNAVMVAASRHKVNPAVDTLEKFATQWDGVERIGSWLLNYLNASTHGVTVKYLSELGSAWIKGVVARVLKPGCKRDDVLILGGAQGCGKSRTAKAIAECIQPNSFTDSIGDLRGKDSRSGILGITIAELSELALMSRSEIENLKAFISTESDHFRQAYGHFDDDFPRTVSFIGTTNNLEYLKDSTGNRRWWPVEVVGVIDVPALVDILPQLLGEAVVKVQRGEVWYVVADDVVKVADIARMDHYQVDVLTDSVLEVVSTLLNGGDCSCAGKLGQASCKKCGGSGVLAGSNPEYVTIASILLGLGIEAAFQDRGKENRVGAILRTNGFIAKRIQHGGVRKSVWLKPVMREDDLCCQSNPTPLSSQDFNDVVEHKVTPVNKKYFVAPYDAVQRKVVQMFKGSCNGFTLEQMSLVIREPEAKILAAIVSLGGYHVGSVWHLNVGNIDE